MFLNPWYPFMEHQKKGPTDVKISLSWVDNLSSPSLNLFKRKNKQAPSAANCAILFPGESFLMTSEIKHPYTELPGTATGHKLFL